MATRIVILGAGTGGTLLANRLRRRYPPGEVSITVVDQDDRHLYQPGLLFVPFGMARPDRLVRSRRAQLAANVTWRCSEIEHVNLEKDEVALGDGDTVPYDVLVVATGARLLPDETDGMTGPWWGETVHSFYTLRGATQLAAALATFERGRLVVNVVDMPIKCPVAPLEFTFLADSFLRRRGVRKQVDITYVTPLDGAFTKPVASAALGSLLHDKGIEIIPEFNTGEIDGRGGTLTSYDGRTVGFDLAVTVPLHGGAAYVDQSDGLGDALGFIPADQATLQAKVKPNVFVIGDAADVPASKAGSVAHFEGDILERNICQFLAAEPLDGAFDGHANCFVETGRSKALLIDFNYDTEPLPGRFPGSLGLPLLRESRLNHAAKLAFEWFYWHALLPGRDVPGIGATMPTAGKRRPPNVSLGGTQ